jgi:hypothetical protein
MVRNCDCCCEKRERISIHIYQFIASSYELPALLSPKLHHPDGRDKKFESLEDLGDLEIVRELIGYLVVDITAYTKLPYIYRLNLDYTPERGQRLYDYLQANCQSGQRCELWSINLEAQNGAHILQELTHVTRVESAVNALTPELVAVVCDHSQCSEAELPQVLVLQ